LEKHYKKKLAFTIRENGFDHPHERTLSSHPPQIYPKSQMMKMKTWMSNATKPKLTPHEKTKNSKRNKLSQFSSKACNDINV
jgi:hypothetical protein